MMTSKTGQAVMVVDIAYVTPMSLTSGSVDRKYTYISYEILLKRVKQSSICIRTLTLVF